MLFSSFVIVVCVQNATKTQSRTYSRIIDANAYQLLCFLRPIDESQCYLQIGSVFFVIVILKSKYIWSRVVLYVILMFTIFIRSVAMHYSFCLKLWAIQSILRYCNPEFIDSYFANLICGRKGIKGGQHKFKSKKVQ